MKKVLFSVMKKAGEPIFITYIQAIDFYCNQIEYAIKIVDLIKGSKNVPLIENRLGKLNMELTDFNNFLSDDFEKYFRRTFIEIEPSKLNEIKKEILRTLSDLKRKFIGKIYKESFIIYESICLKIETAIETDLEFIKGGKLKFVPIGFDLFFKVEKNGLIRTYQIVEYFHLEIRNWLDCINETDNVSEQIQAANNAILLTANKFFGFTHPKVKELKNDAIEHFKTVLNYLKDSDTIKIPPQQPETETPTFTNNFDNIKPTEIYNHFKAGLVEKGYLTEQELNEYLKAAFELQTKPEILFKLKHTPTKQKIYTVFYIYYKDISQKKHERQKEYAALLGDFFEGYKTEIIQTNWARDYKTKR